MYVYVDGNRIGDHICYISDLSKMRAHQSGWDIRMCLDDTLGKIVRSWQSREVMA